jgi:hypothetical protein
MRTTVVSVAIVLMFLSLAFLPVVTVTSQGPAPAQITGIEDYGQKNAADQLIDFLVIHFNLSVFKSGHYRITGSLISTKYSTLIATNTTLKTLGLGEQSIEVKFPSIPIFKNNEDGNFLVQYTIRNDTSPNQWFYEGNYTTNLYFHNQFDSPDNYPSTPEKYIPTIVKESSLNRFVIKNNVTTVWFYYDKPPRLVWFYTLDNKSRTQYNCEFVGVHGFIKGGAGRFQPSNSLYDGLFEEGNVTAVTFMKGKSKIFGDFVTATIVIGDIPFRDQAGNPQRLANISLNITLAAGNRGLGFENNLILGGSQLSIEMNVVLRSSLAMNGLALEQQLWSETSKGYYHDFKLEDASYTEIPRDSTDSADKAYFPGAEPQRIEFVSKNTAEHRIEGYFFWFNQARVDGTSSLDVDTYQYAPKEKKLTIYIGFTTGKTSITTVQSGPLGIGVSEDGNPTLQKYIKPKPTEQPSILITFIGWITAIILVALPLYIDFRRAQKRIKELEEEFGEDL